MMRLALDHLGLAAVGVGGLFSLAIVLRLLAGRDAVLRYRIMSAALCAALILLPLQALTAQFAPHAIAPVTLSTPCPAPNIAAPGVPAAAAFPSQPACDPSIQATFRAATSSSDAPPLPTPPTAPADPRVWPVLLAVYIAGLIAIATVLAARAIVTRRLVRAAHPVTDPRVLRVWSLLVQDARPAPALLESDRLTAPACCALGGRRVILPVGSNALADATLLAAMRHELIHLNRRDGVRACIATGLCALLWFQPLAWVFARLLAADREHSCDALVVRATRQPRSYALALLQFCTLSRPMPRSMSLIGFESSDSISQRITMLSHAMTPAARLRHAAAAGVSVACFVSVAVGHGALTAAADPGPVLAQPAHVENLAAQASEAEPKIATAQTGTTQAARVQPATVQPRMSAEVAAKSYGRTDNDVYRRLVKSGVISSEPGAKRTDLFIFSDRPAAKAAGIRLPIATVNEQETVLTAERATVQGNVLSAENVRLSLPDGSKLRAVFEGRSVTIDPNVGAGTTIRITGGSVRIVDEHGITRVEAQASEQRGTATLALSSSSTTSATTFQLIAADGTRPIPVSVNVNADAPRINPDAPHGAVSWNLTLPANPQFGPGTGELKMQWTYDVDKLAETEGC